MGCRRESMAACDVSINIPARRLIEYGCKGVEGPRSSGNRTVRNTYGYMLARLLSIVQCLGCRIITIGRERLTETSLISPTKRLYRAAHRGQYTRWGRLKRTVL
jgi:hypothetical protein